MKHRIIYMGTPYFASEILTYLLTRKDIDIVAVVTQPDRPVGRKRILTYSLVKEVALKHHLMVYQPEQIKDISQQLESLEAKAIITCAYGQFLPSSILDMTPIGVVNIHASLLPKYRGGAPIQHALKNGEKETGITLMKSDLKMDAGDIYSQLAIDIQDEDTLSSLEEKLIDCSREILERDLSHILNDKLIAVPQNNQLATFAPVIKREDELINLSLKGRDVYNHIRSLIDNPFAYGFLDNKKIKFCRVSYQDLMHRQETGKIIDFSPEEIIISLNYGILHVYELQIEGKQIMTTEQLYPGYHSRWIAMKVQEYV